MNLNRQSQGIILSNLLLLHHPASKEQHTCRKQLQAPKYNPVHNHILRHTGHHVSPSARDTRNMQAALGTGQVHRYKPKIWTTGSNLFITVSLPSRTPAGETQGNPGPPEDSRVHHPLPQPPRACALGRKGNSQEPQCLALGGGGGAVLGFCGPAAENRVKKQEYTPFLFLDYSSNRGAHPDYPG